MSDPVAVITEMRIIKPVKVSTLHQKAERYRDGFVKLFREYEYADLLNEDGTPILDGAGRRVSVTASWFAREMGIPKQTFSDWLLPPVLRRTPEMSTDTGLISDDRTADEGWDLPGVSQGAVDQIRAAVEHNEALIGDPEWRAANGMTPEPEDRRPFSAPDRIHIFRSWVTRMHADDLDDKGWKMLDEVQEQITRLYDELAESK